MQSEQKNQIINKFDPLDAENNAIDKMKEDVIANLSDKLIMLSERLDAIEKLKY